MKDDNYIRFDWAIKRLLRDKANFGVLEGLLTTLLGQKITIANLLESESNQGYPNDKFNRVDMLALTAKGEYVIVEVQITGGIDYFRRMLYAVSKTITEHMKLGMNYKEVKKIYSVNIVYFSLDMKDDYVYHGTTEFQGMHTHTVLKMNADERKRYGISEVSDIFPEYYLLCVNNFNDIALTPLDEWIEYLKNNTISPTATAPGLAEARELLKIDQMSEEEYLSYYSHLKNLSTEVTNIDEALNKGRYEGRAEGLAKGLAKGKAEGLAEGEARSQFQIVSTMRQQGLTAETIAQYTGLSINEIETLL